MPKPWKILIGVVAAPVALVILLTIAWGIAYWTTGDSVASNVTVAGLDVAGSSPTKLSEQIEDLAKRLPSTQVKIEVDGDDLETTAGALGLSINQTSTEKAVMSIGRSDPLVTKPIHWLQRVFSGQASEVRLDVDLKTLKAGIEKLDADNMSEPVEPSLKVGDNGIELIPGKPGNAMTIHDVVSALPAKLSDVSKTINIKVQRSEIATDTSDAEVQELVDKANKVTSGTITLTVAEKKIEIPGKEFRAAFTLLPADPSTPSSTDEPVSNVSSSEEDAPKVKLGMDAGAVSLLLAKYAKVPANPTGVRFDIVGGVPTPVGGQDATVCCTDDAGSLIVAGLLDGKTTIAVPARTITAAEGRKWAAGLGVKEVVSSFTTHHACCAPRVTNIHKISDMTRGILIAPGETFSVNDTVGRRTKEKGFVEAGVINEGEHTTDVGGGVSQYATTLFNAAFFAGLDIPEHKAHSEYLSRYPFGREATLWYPSVDLKIHNQTPYGVVIWPTYTGTSVTITMWSTHTVTGAQTAQHPSSGCGKVTTERTRTWIDGHTEKDKFYASYKCG